MKALLDTTLFFVWVTAYLGLAYAVCQYRRSRAGTAGLAGRAPYRADKDWGVRLGVFVVGVALAGIGYLFIRLLN